MSFPPATLRHIATLCRTRGKRLIGDWRGSEPSRWQPTTVIEPESDLPFTESGAWEFIACLVEEGVPLKQVPMKEPKGTMGYELRVPMRDGETLYIKFRLADGYVIGRSFHYSN